MIQIFLCDDNRNELQTWNEVICDYLEISEDNAKVEFLTPDPLELLNHLNSVPPYMGLYFLDINLPGNMNGLQLASKIRTLDPRGYIVFITSHSEMSYMTFQYKVEAMDFILKDSVTEVPGRIRSCIKAAITNSENSKKQKKDTLKLKLGNQYILLELDEIIYIESSQTAAHKLSIHTTTGIKSIYATLKEIENRLANNPQFVRCHKSVIINQTYIRSIDQKKKEITLSTGKKCPLSITYAKKLTPPSFYPPHS